MARLQLQARVPLFHPKYLPGMGLSLYSPTFTTPVENSTTKKKIVANYNIYQGEAPQCGTKEADEVSIFHWCELQNRQEFNFSRRKPDSDRLPPIFMSKRPDADYSIRLINKTHRNAQRRDSLVKVFPVSVKSTDQVMSGGITEQKDAMTNGIVNQNGESHITNRKKIVIKLPRVTFEYDEDGKSVDNSDESIGDSDYKIQPKPKSPFHSKKALKRMCMATNHSSKSVSYGQTAVAANLKYKRRPNNQDEEGIRRLETCQSKVMPYESSNTQNMSKRLRQSQYVGTVPFRTITKRKDGWENENNLQDSQTNCEIYKTSTFINKTRNLYNIRQKSYLLALADVRTAWFLRKIPSHSVRYR